MPRIYPAVPVVLALCTGALAPTGPRAPPCAADNAGLSVPDGFCALLVGEELGPVRHLVVAPNGDVLAALEGRGGGVLVLRDTNGDGRADIERRFGSGGGSGIALQGGYLYFGMTDRVVRWPWEDGQLTPRGEPEVVVQGLPTGGHGAKGIAVSADGQLYVSIGSRTNSRQHRPAALRQESNHAEIATRPAPGSVGLAHRPGPGEGERFATGLRNPMALALQPGTGILYAGMHGRDQSGDNWGFSDRDNAEKPAGEPPGGERGADFGWPYCYYDPIAKKLVLAPEYGGDGSTVGRCAAKRDPEIGFPGHWAPMAVAFYDGTLFPAGYLGGAFIAFHGSWNRAPRRRPGTARRLRPLPGRPPPRNLAELHHPRRRPHVHPAFRSRGRAGRVAVHGGGCQWPDLAGDSAVRRDVRGER